MSVNKIEGLFATIKPGLEYKKTQFWLTIAILFSLIYSFLAWQQAFGSEYVVQDDARQHVFWMRRWLDSELFPNDVIADYFQSVAPWGYRLVYTVPASMGIDPIFISKLIPSILGIATTYYCFWLTLELLPIPLSGFVTSLLLNQNLWLQDGLVSGTPKAFAIPLLIAFLYYYLRNSLVGTSITILFLGLFYPSFVFLCSGLLLLRLFRKSDFALLLKKQISTNYYLCLAGLIVAFLVLLPYAISSSEFAPTISAKQALLLPDFALNGRSSFFNDTSHWDFWFNGGRSGLRVTSALMPPLTYLGILLPVILRLKLTFPLAQQVNPKIKILHHLLLVSVVMFLVAHIFLFTLHLPSRYTQNSFRIVLAIAGGISTTIIAHSLVIAILPRLTQNYQLKKILARLLVILLGTLLIVSPHLNSNFIWTQYEQGNVPELYTYLQQQPKDTLIASLTYEADNLPTFAQRSILVSKEYAIPYHTGYYFPFRQKAVDLIAASYSEDLAMVQRLIRQYQIDYFLIEDSSFTSEYIANNDWIMQHQKVAQNAIKNLQQNKEIALQKVQSSCSVFNSKSFHLISGQCILAINS